LTRGLTTVSGACTEGYYCTTQSAFKFPNEFIVGEVTYFDGSQGGPCKAGQYCAAGDATANECTAGFYCHEDLLATTAGQCKAGFYCEGSAYSWTPADEASVGGLCGTGYYCAQGSSAELQCNVGTFSAAEGIEASADCNACTPGKYCDDVGATTFKGDCGEGFYCPSGITEEFPSEYGCDIGYYCPTGAHEPILCPDGSVTDSVKQGSCTTCAAGSICTANDVEEDCPLGYFCPTGDKKEPCPLGKYGILVGQLTEALACGACPAGYACNEMGLAAATTKCDGGYYCEGSATT